MALVSRIIITSTRTTGGTRLARMVVARRSLLSPKFYHATSLARGSGGGGHYPPPMPPFARSPASFEKMTENTDCLWDDGVAPELALDFDLPNTSSSEALWTLGGVFGFFAVFYQGVKATSKENPALNHSTDCVIPDYSFLEHTTVRKDK